MRISRYWLQKFFDAELPDVQALAEALTFHAFEIESLELVGEDDVLDVKVTANRGHDCLSHRGVAKELAAILRFPLVSDPLKERPDLEPKTDAVSVFIENKERCHRYIAGYIRGIKVGPSPKWLKERLEAVGQRSINNVVDATNFVMFNLGQPLHAFDAGKLMQSNDAHAITVRNARASEKMLALDEKEYTLSDSMLVIADAHADEAVGIAGVKGGMPAGITESTKDIIIESANFDGPSTRKTAAILKLRTDASARFEQVISPELAGYGMRAVVDLILSVAGGELVGFVDEYPDKPEEKSVSVTAIRVRQILGDTFGKKEIIDAFTRLGFRFEQKNETFKVAVPFERLDIAIPEDLVEEVGRIIGYDHVPAHELPPLQKKPEVNPNFYAAEKIREELLSKGYSEVYTSVFADKGERVISNKIDGVRPYLRQTLTVGLQEALKKNIPNKELLGIKEVKLFEIGPVWEGGKERTMVGTIGEKEQVAEKFLAVTDSDVYEQHSLSSAKRYRSFSRYPYIVRDMAAWVPEGTDENKLRGDIQVEAGDLCSNVRLFDRFEKNGRVSLAFRLIFQSFDRTLTDAEANIAMEKVYTWLKAEGFEIR